MCRGHGTLVVRGGAGKRATVQKAAARVFVNPARLSGHHPTLRAFFAPYGIERRGSLFYARASVRADHDALRVIIGGQELGECFVARVAKEFALLSSRARLKRQPAGVRLSRSRRCSL